jgi:hypothetical protein
LVQSRSTSSVHDARHWCKGACQILEAIRSDEHTARPVNDVFEGIDS